MIGWLVDGCRCVLGTPEWPSSPTHELLDYFCRQFETTFARSFGLVSFPPYNGWTPETLRRGDPCWLLKLRWSGLKEYKWKGSFLGWFVGLVAHVKEIFTSLGCPSRPPSIPIAPQAGQATVLGHLSLNTVYVSGGHIYNYGNWYGSRLFSSSTISIHEKVKNGELMTSNANCYLIIIYNIFPKVIP